MKARGEGRRSNKCQKAKNRQSRRGERTDGTKFWEKENGKKKKNVRKILSSNTLL